MMTDEQSPADVQRELRELVRVTGARVAIQAAIAVAQDPKAPPAARATAAGLLLRADGFGGFGKNDPDGHAKEAHEMTGDEISASLARLRRELKTRPAGPDVFD